MENNKLWQSVLSQVQFCISKANFETWFKNTKIISEKDGAVSVSVPNSFSKEWLENKYHKLVLKILRNTDEKIKEVRYTVETPNQKVQILKSPKHEEIEEPQLMFKEFEVDRKTNLNPRYTFDNFVVGSFNELAYAASLGITKNPGLTYNPFFVYGGVGLGKTHLLEAVGNKIKENFPKKTVEYIPSNKFIAEIINAIKNRNTELLKAKLQKIDVLIIDDIQFLAGKEKTQEEFFYLFNNLYEKNKQIILSSDRPPKAISSLEERLRSRFEGGMMADIGLPDYETRLAILKFKEQEKNIQISEEILEYIASNITRNIRELEGALNQVIVYQKINNKSLNSDIAKKLLKNLLFSPFKIATQKKIVQIVAEFYDLKEKDIFDKTRKKEIVKPRQIAMYLLREELKNSFPSIGRKFNDKDHTTVIYAYNKIMAELKKNSKLVEEMELIKQRIYGG